MVGLAANTVRAYERGIRHPDISTVTQIATLADVNPAVLSLDHEVWLSMKPELEKHNEPSPD